MKVPFPKNNVGDLVLGIDKYRNEVLIMKNRTGGTFDMMTDGRVFLSPEFARHLAKSLLEFAEWAEIKELKPKRGKVDKTKEKQ